MNTRQHTHGDGLGITFNAGNLSGEKDAGMLLEVEGLRE